MSDRRAAEADERRRVGAMIRAGIKGTRDSDLDGLAGSLGLPAAAVYGLDGVFLGSDKGGQYFGFPMRSPDPSADGSWGWCGFSRRYGREKKTLGRAGLFLPVAQPAGQVLYVVEGASDVAAMVHAGLPAVGRPSNIAGSELIDLYVRTHPDGSGRKVVVVVAENDEKPSGLAPGLSGAVAVADRVRASLAFHKVPLPVFVRRMPGVVKDPREWFKHNGFNEVSVRSLVSSLTSAIKLS
jgi:hypothetical protein